MITVKLLNDHNISPNKIANHAAKICYTSTILDINNEKTIDVENQLFNTGHHTTYEHQLFNFEIEGIAVSDVTFGLHLTHPYYNTDQRSGRYSKMFDNPDFEEIRSYIKDIYNPEDLDLIMDYVEFGCSIFKNNILRGIEIAKDILKEERINDEEYINKSAEKLAQEQLRNFISAIFNTGLFYSINIPTIAAIYERPSTKVAAILGDKIKEEVLKYYPELSYIFREEKRILSSSGLIKLLDNNKIIHSPDCKLIGVHGDLNNIVVPEIDDMMPIDKTIYMEKYQANNLIDIHTKVKTSLVVMGQDQRHRSIKRTIPVFTGEFYSPEIITRLGLEKDINELMNKWKNLHGKIDENLFETLAPFGAVMEYEKKANINALAHEQAKRLCWCAQEEIYNFNRILKEQIVEIGNKKLIDIFLPPCIKSNGKCYEGARFCRRKEKNSENPCPIRKI